MSASDMKSIRPMHAGKQLLSPRRLAAGFPEHWRRMRLRLLKPLNGTNG